MSCESLKSAGLVGWTRGSEKLLRFLYETVCLFVLHVELLKDFVSNYVWKLPQKLWSR
jgi:hypothetical protein